MKWYTKELASPSMEQCEAIVRSTRPTFEIAVSGRRQISVLDREVTQFTEEQYEAIDVMEHNPRVLYEGPAGTGKTFLAVETARRAALQGMSVLLLCYNRLLGEWLARELRGTSRVVATTLHKQMLALARSSGPPEEDASGFWTHELPELAFLAAVERETQGADLLVVDEAQDLMQAAYLDVLDALLGGGLAAGKWRFFGDFANQSIYGSPGAGPERLLSRAPDAARFSLHVNCRNTPRIAELVALLAGLTPGYRRVLRTDDGLEPAVHYYRQPAEQGSILARSLEGLFEDGYTGADIVVLSPTQDCSAAQLRAEPWVHRLRPYLQKSDGHIGYTTIHAFKGLEAKAVVLTDIEQIASDRGAALVYVGATRALHRLVIIAQQRVKNEARKRVLDDLGSVRR
jgi:hypothetical protein